MTYILDSSSIIRGQNEIYIEQLFPDIWQNINKLISNNMIYIPKEVISEIYKDNAAKTWLDGQRSNLLTPSDDQIQTVENEVADLAGKYPNLNSRSGADYYVVAWAKILDGVAISQESHETANTIPTVCKAEDVKTGDLVTLISNEGWRFVNAPGSVLGLMP